MNIRYPGWAKNGASIKLNGKAVKVSQQAGSYISLNRKWKAGDKIEVSFPMALQVIPTNDNPDKVALAYGPIVLAGTMGTNGFISRAPYSNPRMYNDYYTYNYNVPGDITQSLNLKINKLNDAIKPLAGEKLTFKTIKEGIILKPLYDIHRERYVVYWDIAK